MAVSGMAYLDHNAGAPVRPQVVDAMAQALALGGNPSSVHGAGRAARAMVERARGQVAALVGAQPSQVVFTSGGTEANNLVLQGCGARRVLVSQMEHASVRDVLPAAGLVPVLGSGLLDLAALDDMLGGDPQPALVSLMAVNNETGIIQPVAQAAELCARHGAVLHCDMAQAVGRMVVSVADLNVGFVTFSAHKLGGPSGIGAVVLPNATIDLAPILRGGGQERRRRAGTENVSGIVGFGLAAELASQEVAEHLPDRIRALRDGLEERALALVPDAQVVGADVERVCNTSCLVLPGVPSQTQVMALDLAGVAVSAGAACSSGKVAESPVLRAMGLGAGFADAAIRVSLGPTSGPADIERFLTAWVDLARRKGLKVKAAA